jgi:hypothetical protein
MNLPKNIILLIFSYLIHDKCYRCNKYISIIDNIINYDNKIFCSYYCTEYQHY